MKKVTLDLLEEFPGAEVELPGTAVDESGADQIPLDQESSEASAGSGQKWAFNKLLFIAAPIVLMVLVVSGILFFYLTRQVSSVPKAQKTISSNKPDVAHQVSTPVKAGASQYAGTQPDAVTGTSKFVYLKDFIIDLKDAKGNSFVLMCDVAFDIDGKTKPEILENNRDIRNIIYKTAQSRNVVALRSVEERKKMKIELTSAVEKLLGEGSVKNVYFMNYFIM